MIVRPKVLIPFSVLFVIGTGVFFLQLNSWIIHRIQDGISSITHTKTDVSDVRISLKHSRIEIGNIQIASNMDEFKNSLEVSDVEIDIKFLPLLKKVIVIDGVSIRGIALGTKRYTSGKLDKDFREKFSTFSRTVGQAIDALIAQEQNLQLTKLTDFQIPKDPREAIASVILQSQDAFKASVLASQEAQFKWKSKLDELQTVSLYEGRYQEASKQMDKRSEAIRFFQDEQKRLKTLLTDVQLDRMNLEKTLEAAELSVNSDYEKARKSVSLESLGIDNLSRVIFGDPWIPRVRQVLEYRNRMSAFLNKRSPRSGIEVDEKPDSTDVYFTTSSSQPWFTLPSSKLVFKGLDAEKNSIITQLYQVQLKDINSDPRIYGKPSSLEFKAELSDLMIGEVEFTGNWDYTREPLQGQYDLAVNKIKAENWPMGIPKIFPIRISSGTATAKSHLSFSDNRMEWTSRIDFKDIVWELKDIHKIGILIPVLEEALESVRDFYLEFKIEADDKNFSYKVTSDLDPIFYKAVMKSIEIPWKQFDDLLKREVSNRSEKYRGDAESAITQFKSKIEGRLSDYFATATHWGDELEKMNHNSSN